MDRVSYMWKILYSDDYAKVYSKLRVDSVSITTTDLFIVAFDGTWWRGIHRGVTIIKGKNKENIINQAEQWMDEHE